MNNEQLARTIQGEIEKSTGEKIEVSVKNSVAGLTGWSASYQNVVEAGHTAGGFDQVRGVVNEINYPNKKGLILPQKVSDELSGREFDVVIVGGGVIGCAVARELSRYNLSIALVERHDDVGLDETAHNNGMIHPASFTESSTLKWEMNYKGNAMYDRVAQELDVDFKRIGTLMVAEKPEEESFIPFIVERARQQRDPEPKVLGREELDRVEPGLAPNVRKGALIWNAGIISPFELTIAYAENAVKNGIEIFLETSVIGVQTEDNSIKAVDTTRGTIRTRFLINAAGIYSDKIAEFAGDRFFTIHPRRGETVIFDKEYQPVKTVLLCFNMGGDRDPHSKGGGIIPTIDGNLQFGPTAEEVEDREDVSTTKRGIDALFNKFAPVLSRLKPDYPPPTMDKIITYFAGCRAATYKEDFIIEPSGKIIGLIHVAGIQSPGLASTPAIAERVVDIVREQTKLVEKPDYDPYRKKTKRFWEMDRKERQEIALVNPLYGHIICRCENVSEGEIVDALHDVIPIKSIDAIKRRARAGMGRCQGGFCLPRVLAIINRELDIGKELVTKNGGASFILSGKAKERRKR